MAVALAIVCAWIAPALAAGTTYPPDYERIVSAAQQESRLVIFGSTSLRLARFLIDDFKAAYPNIEVEYNALSPAELDTRLRQSGPRSPIPDVVWSIGMDLQLKQALEGRALAYRSPEAQALPSWARWNDELYGTTFEPVAIAYNRRLIPESEVPRTHEAFIKLLQSNPERYQNKVTTYDLHNPEVGAIVFKLDAANSARFWQLADALAARGVALQASTDAMMDRLSSGESLIAYNVMASEAINRAKRDPMIGIAFMTDYDVVLSRVVLISKDAEHPNAAKLWVDYILSARGQKQLFIGTMYPIRQDVATEPGVDVLRRLPAVAKPATLNSALAQLGDSGKSIDFEKRLQSRWRAGTRMPKSESDGASSPGGTRSRAHTADVPAVGSDR